MKKYKFYQWPLLFLLSLLIFISCGKKNYPAANITDNPDQYTDNKNVSGTNYRPAQVIVISDQLAKINKEGEMYYDDENGYRYWRSADGKYYLDNKHATAKKISKKRIKKLHRQSNQQDYPNE